MISIVLLQAGIVIFFIQVRLICVGLMLVFIKLSLGFATKKWTNC
jgi:hypothetical protein